MTVNKLQQILDLKLKEANIYPGDLLFVHSSLKRIIKKFKLDHDLNITPQEVFDALLNYLGNNGTLVLPLFNFEFTSKKIFDIRNTPSQMGALTEIARLHPKVVRTGHPIYIPFAAIGAKSNIFKNVRNYSGYGSDSPFALLHHNNSKIAVIGLDDQNSMTSYHYVEEMHNVDYRYYKKFSGEYTDWDGNTSCCEFSLFVRDLERGVNTDVNRMSELLWEKNLYQGEKFDQGYGIRSINFTDFYNEVSRIILAGQAENYLFSINK